MAAPILVVDDEPSIRELIRTVLEDEGYTVQEAADGEAALRQVTDRPPALVLLDLTMPRMSGWEVQAALRRQGSACQWL